MLTPVFVCSQDSSFIIVAITLSAMCKVMGASFDISQFQFTFHCSPYYLRLKFDRPIAEGRGERATFDIASSILTVFIPKENPGEEFPNLDNPAYLIATDMERRRLVQLVGGECSRPSTEGVAVADEEAVNGDEEGEDTEFRQRLQVLRESGLAAREGLGDYGFAASFNGAFAALDADVVADVLDLPCNPDETNAEHRRQLRTQREQEDFDEDALLLSFEDAEGEVEHLLRYVPQHQKDYLRALDDEGIRYIGPAEAAESTVHSVNAGDITDAVGNAARRHEMLEEEEVVLPLSSGVVKIWAGNVAEFKRPLVEEVQPAELATGEEQEGCDSVGPAGASSLHLECHAVSSKFLAVPQQRPPAQFTEEEHGVLLRIRAPRLLFPPPPGAVNALTVDILLSETYDDIVTEGAGCSESLWNVCKLSPSLSWLDSPDTVYDACVAFARRVLVYPLHRNFALVQRAFSLMGIRLLLGKSYVVKALLRVRDILAHAEHRHVLVSLFMGPLIGYWMNVQDADGRLAQLALEVHAHATRSAPEWETAPPTAATTLLVQSRRQLLPLHVLNLGLPIA